MFDSRSYFFPIFVTRLDDLVEVFYFVHGQGCVACDGEPCEWGAVGCQFNAGAIALGYVCGEVFANVALRAGLHELVFIAHVVEVGPGMAARAAVIVASLEIE